MSTLKRVPATLLVGLLSLVLSGAALAAFRPDASTVSYTMVRCDDRSISMGYLEGSPCLRAGFDALVTVGLCAGRGKVAGV